VPVCFELLETMRWTPEHGFFLRERHFKRLKESAEYFDFAFNAEAALERLEAAMDGLAQAQRVRLLVARDGGVRIEHAALVHQATPLRVTVAVEAVDLRNVWLYHKTTHRAMYAKARAQGRSDEVILWNRSREVTEATTANVVAEVR